LKTRINIFNKHVDGFVVFDFGESCENLASETVIHIKAPKFFLDQDFDLIYETIKILDSKKLYVEDILIFSKVNEIPNFESLTKNLAKFSIKPVLFRQTKVFWDSNKISSKQHFSSFALTYSQYLHNKNVHETFIKMRSPIPVNQLTIDCGWQLNGFQNKAEYCKSLEFWNQIELNEGTLIDLHSNRMDLEGNLLMEQKQNIPTEFNNFETVQKVREPKLLQITTDSNVHKNSSVTSLLVQEGVIKTNCGITHQFIQPSQIFYEKNHKLDYSKNETLKVLKNLGCLFHDNITLYNEKTLDKVTLTYQEFVKNIPCELF
jgi:hypothetical protein